MARKASPAKQAQLGAAMARFADLFRAWGAEGGKVGGKKRMTGLSADERRKLAKKAAAARWSKREEHKKT